MGRKVADGRPRGRMSSYAFFVQTCREEQKRTHPGATVVFCEFTRKCSEKWKLLTPNEKKYFEDMAEKDKARYNNEISYFQPPSRGNKRTKGRREAKDPNAPKRSLSAFFHFCSEERSKVKSVNPSWSLGEIAKELGRRWQSCPDKSKFETLAAEDKKRYAREMAAYKGGGVVNAVAPSPKKAKKEEPEEKEEEEDDEEEDDEEDEEDEDDD